MNFVDVHVVQVC